MNEKEMFLNRLAAETATTIKVLKAYPADKANLKPAEILRSARDLAFVFVAEQALADSAVNGQMSMEAFAPATGTLPEIIKRYEAKIAETTAKVKAMPDADWQGEMDFLVGPNKMAKVRRGDILWMTLNDMIHHRGQFSVYLRMAGGKLSSIYGPTADEPWM